MSSILLRKAIATDAEVMPALEQSAGELFQTIPDLAWIAAEANLDVARYRTLIAGDWCWIAETADGKPVGFLAAEEAGTHLHLCELGVVQSHQGRGIGRALLQSLIEAARGGAFDAITLTTFRMPPWNAPFYERAGFQLLADDQPNDRLHSLLTAEAARGLPPETRCAMQHVLSR